MNTFIEWGYPGLFLASFLAATVVPFSSEFVLSAAMYVGLNAWYCVAVATLGNWMGGMTSYYLGKLGKLQWIEKYMRIKPEKLNRYASSIQRYGDWFAFFSFVPFLGDVIAVATGFFRCKMWKVALAMFLGKLARYIFWMYLSGFVF